MARKSSGYWKKRMAEVEDAGYQSGAAYYKDVQEQYQRALQKLQADMELWYARLAANNEISYAEAKKLLNENELEEFKWTVEQYIKAGKENAIDQRWMRELENASAKYHISRLEAMKLQLQQHAELLSAEFEGGMTDFLRKSYGDQYYRTAYEIAKGSSVGSNLVKLDTRKIDLLLKKPWAQDGKNFSDRIWSNKEKLVQNLHTNLTQSIIRGESPKKAIDGLSKAMNVSKSQAGNLIMTETAALSSRAQQSCFKELGVEEFEVVETLDGNTCEVCRGMDGKHFPMSDYRVGETAPPFHPRCRGCTCPYFDDEFSQLEKRVARDPKTGDTVYVPADMTYEGWKKKFVVEKEVKPDIIKTGTAFGALTDKNDPLYVKRDKHAISYYNAVRNSKKENIVKTISTNSGLSKNAVSKVYDHVFINEYDLYGGHRCFDPDYDMAESFRRLREGKEVQEHDRIMLRHEYLEYGLMKKLGMPYEEAHALAESKYNYREALDAFKKKKGL